MNKTGKDLRNELPTQDFFQSLGLREFGVAAKKVRGALWKIVLINLLLSLVYIALSVSVVVVVILGLLKLFGVV